MSHETTPVRSSDVALPAQGQCGRCHGDGYEEHFSTPVACSECRGTGRASPAEGAPDSRSETLPTSDELREIWDTIVRARWKVESAMGALEQAHRSLELAGEDLHRRMYEIAHPKSGSERVHRSVVGDSERHQ